MPGESPEHGRGCVTTAAYAPPRRCRVRYAVAHLWIHLVLLPLSGFRRSIFSRRLDDEKRAKEYNMASKTAGASDQTEQGGLKWPLETNTLIVVFEHAEEAQSFQKALTESNIDAKVDSAA